MTNPGFAGPNPPVSQIINAWTARLCELLHRQTGAKPTVRHMGESHQDPDSAVLWWQCEVVGTSITVFAGASDPNWRAIVRMLRNSDVTGEDGDPKRQYLEWLGQSFDSRGVQIDRPPQSNRREIVEIRFPEVPPIQLLFLAETKQAKRAGLGVLLNVEMPITIRFGAKKMLLRDLVSLNAGSMIEFDRHINDPVEILISRRVVARGEAIVVRGRYGVRITEIADAQDRLETSASFTRVPITAQRQ